jgi:signal transduction histidine kinase
MFDLGNTLTIVTVVANLILGFLVLFSNPKKALNVSFAIFSLITAAWVFSNFNFLTEHSLFIIKTQYALGAAIMPAAFLWIFILLEKKITSLKILLFSIITLIVVFVPYIDGLLIKNLILGTQGPVLITGYLFNYYSLFSLLLYFIIIYELFWGIKKYSDVRKTQIKYILVGTLIFGGITMLVSFILPFFKIVVVAPYDAQSSIFFVAFSAYAITKYKLFNIKVIATELLTFTIWIALLINIFSSNGFLDYLVNTIIFIFVIVAGILLIRSVIKEVRQREQIAKMAEDIRRAYEVEKKAKEDIDKAYTIEKHAKEELEKLDKIKNQFLAQTQHDLRTPLGVIRDYCDLLSDGMFGKQSKKSLEVIKRIQVVAENKIKDVNNFLDTTQFQLGKKVVSLTPGIALSPMLDEIVSGLTFQAESKGIYLKLEKPKETPMIEADREKLKAALFNIIDNAIKYTPKGGVAITVTVAAQNGKSMVTITVKDTGIGVPKEKLTTLFDNAFERGEQAKKTFATGRGIGLYLSNQIIKAHNGKVRVDSEGEGEGSVFTIELPMSGADALDIKK